MSKKTAKSVRVELAQPGSWWTLAFEANTLQVFLAWESTNEDAKGLRPDWRAVGRITLHEVERGLARRNWGGCHTSASVKIISEKEHSTCLLSNILKNGRVLEDKKNLTSEPSSRP